VFLMSSGGFRSTTVSLQIYWTRGGAAIFVFDSESKVSRTEELGTRKAGYSKLGPDQKTARVLGRFRVLHIQVCFAREPAGLPAVVYCH
jgi:hypothetical protein